ncbi:TRAPPC1 family protein [Megaselia abdita]
MINNLYIFDKYGNLLYYDEWNRPKKGEIKQEEEQKLMYGMLISIKSFVNRLSPTDTREGFLYYKTNKYALHYLETPSGLKFVMNTDVAAMNVREFLQQLYGKVWVEYVVRDPLWEPGTEVTSSLFKSKLDDFVKQSPIFGIRNI